jgi:hypothetical protein
VAQTIEMLITASNVELSGARQWRGFSFRIDRSRPSIATMIKRERSEKADRTARLVHVIWREGFIGKSPTTGRQRHPAVPGSRRRGGGLQAALRSGAWRNVIDGRPETCHRQTKE